MCGKETNRKPLNILQIIAPLSIGGAENVLIALNNLIDSDKFNIINCIYINPFRKKNDFLKLIEEKSYPVEVVHMLGASPLALIKNITDLIKIIKNNKIHILHTHGYRSDIVGLLAAKLTNRPIVSTVHGWTGSTKKVYRYETFQKYLLRFFNAVIPVSRDISKTLIDWKVRESKLYILHNIFQPTQLATNKNLKIDLKTQYTLDNQALVIGVFGRFSPEKGHYFMLQAFQIVKQYENKIKLLLVGDGDEREILEQFVARHDLKQDVIFCGFQNDTSSFYDLIDILVIPSITEGIPLVLLEAMYYQKPIIATEVGGIPELITSGYNGELVPSRDPEALSSKLLELINYTDMRLCLGKNAKSYFQDYCNPNKWINKIESIYEQIGHV